MSPRSKTVREEARKAAEVRQAARAERTPHQQLKLLDDRFGVGLGAAKERARLQKLMDNK